MKLRNWQTPFVASLAATSSAEKGCTVHLQDYGSFSGTTINETYSGHALPQAVDAWLGMDYASQPVGHRRFTPSSWPSPFNGTKYATSYGKACIQELSSSLPLELQDEACLNFNVYRTPGVPLEQKLPVLVWIHGGSFYAGSYKSFDGASFAASSPAPIVVVNFHYRVNSFGSLPSRLLNEEGLSNINIRDQRLFLEFVQKHIHSFGGDAENVTIGGRSAGGHSVGIHYFHNYGADADSKPLFARAIHQSGSVTSRAFPKSDLPLYVSQYQEYMGALGCPSNGTNAEALRCLRSVDANEIRNVSTTIFRKYELDWAWAFQPVQGGELFERSGSASGVNGTFFHVPTISSTLTNEARFWRTGAFETNSEVLDFIQNVSPALNQTDLSLIEALYPDPAQYADSPYANSPNSTQYARFQAAMSDYAYICPGQETAYRTSSAGVPTWKLHFNTNNSFPAWQGIPHTADTAYTWNDPSTQYPEISRIYHAYLASFVLTGDPNTYRLEGTPEWDAYKPGGYGLASEPGKQLLVEPGASGIVSGTRIELDESRREQCLFWRDPERAPRLNK
jgi:acetylcholinesterase